MVGTKAQSELIPLVEQNSITKNSCNEQFYLFDFSGEFNVKDSQYLLFALLIASKQSFRAFTCLQDNTLRQPLLPLFGGSGRSDFA